MTPNQQLDAELKEWNELRTWIENAKLREQYLRQKLANQIFQPIKLATGAFPEGTNSLVAQGEQWSYRAKLGSQWKREIDETLLVPTMQEAALPIALSNDLIRVKRELSVKTYRLLPPDKRVIVDKMLTVSQGPITLEAIPFPK